MDLVPKSLWGMLAAAVAAIAALILIFWKFDPYSADWPVFVLLFMSFLVVANGLAIPAVYFYKLRQGSDDISVLMPLAIRRGLIIGISITLIFAMQVMRVLAWWNGLSVVVIAVILDMYFKK